MGKARSPGRRGAARAQGSHEKHESLELNSKTRESELAKALESAWSAKAEAHKALQEMDVVKKIAAVRHSLCKASMWRSHFCYLHEFGAL